MIEGWSRGQCHPAPRLRVGEGLLCIDGQGLGGEVGGSQEAPWPGNDRFHIVEPLVRVVEQG